MCTSRYDEEQRPSKRSKPEAALRNSGVKEEAQSTSEQQQAVSDVSAVAFGEGMNSSGAATSYGSAFSSFTPAKPPAAHPSWGSSSSRLISARISTTTPTISYKVPTAASQMPLVMSMSIVEQRLLERAQISPWLLHS